MSHAVLLFALFTTFSTFESKIISTSLGKLEGNQIDDFYVFKKIPFAKPPLGELRFQKPEKAEKWKGVLDATEYGPACLSNSSVSKSPQKWVDEDCLHLNIFTSDHCLRSKNCPVVFYIHGGGLAYDSAVMFNDSYIWNTFTSKDIVFAIPAFRLGIFSHFVVQDQSVAPNNLAIYDIMLALEYVHHEIQNFGGDKKRVTLFGHSYGASISSALSFSTKINQDLSLFQQAVAMSGPLEFQPLEFQVQRTETFVKAANCTPPIKCKLTQRQKDLYSMKCLQNIDSLELLRIQRSLEDADLPEFKFLTLREPFFQEVSWAKFMDTPKNIPMLTGVILNEMDFTSREKDFLIELFDFENPVEIEEKYRNDVQDGTYDCDHHVDKSCQIFLRTFSRVVKLRTNNIPAYLYEYTYPKHAKHTDDLFYLMGVHGFEMDENEQKLGEVYRRIFSNFVKFGSPGEGFEMANLENSTYFNVFWNETSGERPQMKSGFEKKIIDYWFKDMVEYDRKISELKASKRKTPELRLYSETAVFKYSSVCTILILIAFIFFTGYCFGKYFCVNRKSLYIRLEGSDIIEPYVKNI